MGRAQLLDTAPSSRARTNLFALAMGLEQLVSASLSTNPFLTPQLLSLGTAAPALTLTLTLTLTLALLLTPDPTPTPTLT